MGLVNSALSLISLCFVFQELEFDVREREPHYTMLLTKGDNIIQAGHPAPGPIEVRMPKATATSCYNRRGPVHWSSCFSETVVSWLMVVKDFDKADTTHIIPLIVCLFGS